jgi:hypothetical protein
MIELSIKDRVLAALLGVLVVKGIHELDHSVYNLVGEVGDLEFSVGAILIALSVLNRLRWSGEPTFQGPHSCAVK